MPDATTLRDSTQVVLSREALDSVAGELDREFTVTVVERDACAYVIGSPVEIKRLTAFLVRRGVTVA